MSYSLSDIVTFAWNVPKEFLLYDHFDCMRHLKGCIPIRAERDSSIMVVIDVMHRTHCGYIALVMTVFGIGWVNFDLLHGVIV